jgi:hypothetical protein
MTPVDDDISSSLVGRLPVSKLLALYSAILGELRERGIVRSANSPVGDYAEHLFATAFGWQLAGNSSSGHDALDGTVRYQIKSRRLHRYNSSRQLSFIRKLPDAPFDYLAGVLFNEDYSVWRAAIVPHALLEPNCRFSKHANGWLFKLEDAVWGWPDVRDVTDELRAAAGRVG